MCVLFGTIKNLLLTTLKRSSQIFFQGHVLAETWLCFWPCFRSVELLMYCLQPVAVVLVLIYAKWLIWAKLHKSWSQSPEFQSQTMQALFISSSEFCNTKSRISLCFCFRNYYRWNKLCFGAINWCSFFSWTCWTCFTHLLSISSNQTVRKSHLDFFPLHILHKTNIHLPVGQATLTPSRSIKHTVNATSFITKNQPHNYATYGVEKMRS